MQCLGRSFGTALFLSIKCRDSKSGGQNAPRKRGGETREAPHFAGPLAGQAWLAGRVENGFAAPLAAQLGCGARAER